MLWQHCVDTKTTTLARAQLLQCSSLHIYVTTIHFIQRRPPYPKHNSNSVLVYTFMLWQHCVHTKTTTLARAQPTPNTTLTYILLRQHRLHTTTTTPANSMAAEMPNSHHKATNRLSDFAGTEWTNEMSDQRALSLSLNYTCLLKHITFLNCWIYALKYLYVMRACVRLVLEHTFCAGVGFLCFMHTFSLIHSCFMYIMLMIMYINDALYSSVFHYHSTVA